MQFSLSNPAGIGAAGLMEPNEVGTVVTAFYLSKADGMYTHVKKGGVVDGSLLYETWINFQGVRQIGNVPATEISDSASQAILDGMGEPLTGRWRCLSPQVDGIGRFNGMPRSFGQFQRIE